MEWNWWIYCFHFCVSVCVSVRTQFGLQQCVSPTTHQPSPSCNPSPSSNPSPSPNPPRRIYALSERLLVSLFLSKPGWEGNCGPISKYWQPSLSLHCNLHMVMSLTSLAVWLRTEDQHGPIQYRPLGEVSVNISKQYFVVTYQVHMKTAKLKAGVNLCVLGTQDVNSHCSVVNA